MLVLTGDFETFFSSDYTLKKLPIEEYVRDDRFQAQCFVAKVFDHEGFVCRGPAAVDAWIRAQNWANIYLIAHNACFEGFILSERYDARPAYIFDTLSMARAINGPLEPASLEELAKRYDLPPKTVPYSDVRGRRWEEMDNDLRDKLCRGALTDVEITEQLFKKFARGFPKEELSIINLTISMYTQPRLRGDAGLFARLACDERTEKDALLEEIGLKESDLQSTATLLRILESYGETNISRKKTVAGSVPQFASKDDWMLENSGRDDIVGKILRARLAVKSTLEETRANRLAAMSSRGALPVYQKYFGAITGRWSGGERCNIQNLPKEGQLRAGLMAPEGQSFVILDFSQIEYRILCALAGQNDKLDALAGGRDLYCEFAAKLFGRTITRDDVAERTLAKTITLGSGYGQGKDTCARTCKAKGFGFPREITDQAIDLYRSEHRNVVALWRQCDQLLPTIAAGWPCRLEGTPLQFADRCLLLPNGLKCRFDLTFCQETGGWFRRTARTNGPAEACDGVQVLLGKGYTSYWGGGLTEFCCQALARIRLSELMLKAKSKLGLTPVFLVHDEYVTLAADSDANGIFSSLLELAAESSPWWQDNPPVFAAEGRIAKRYGEYSDAAQNWNQQENAEREYFRVSKGQDVRRDEEKIRSQEGAKAECCGRLF